jgi:hypothetical protein
MNSLLNLSNIGITDLAFGCEIDDINLLYKFVDIITSNEYNEIYKYNKNNSISSKVLYNNIIEINVSDDLWINRIATFINKSRVPKDWSDKDFSDFKIKIKELALKIAIVETTIGSYDYPKSKKYNELFEKLKTLSKPEQLMFLREFSTK